MIEKHKYSTWNCQEALVIIFLNLLLKWSIIQVFNSISFQVVAIKSNGNHTGWTEIKKNA